MVIKKVSNSSTERRKRMRSNLWPEIKDDMLWLRSTHVGFTTIPRTMSLIGRIMNIMSGKGFPVFETYLTLWCWVFDEAFVEIRNPKEFAYESGFSGPRGEATWRNRMRRLENLGFIAIKSGIASDFQYILIFNPIKVIKQAYKDKLDDISYNALVGRLIQIGADDLDDKPSS
jgi:hypothetical protein